jgi:hypothetical protein
MLAFGRSPVSGHEHRRTIACDPHAARRRRRSAARSPARGLRLRLPKAAPASNIYKYYVAYLLVQGEYMQRRALKRQ